MPDYEKLYRKAFIVLSNAEHLITLAARRIRETQMELYVEDGNKSEEEAREEESIE